MPIALSRLRLAREIAGLSKKALAEKLGLAPSTITAYEDGSISPGDNLPEIANALGMPGLEAFFLEDELPEIPEGAVSFRSRRSMLKRTRQKSLALSQLASFKLAPFLEDRFVLPDVNIPDDLPSDPESAAVALRSYWELGKGPIANVVHLLEAQGVLVFFLNEACKSVDAFNYTIGHRPFVFLNTSKPSGERGRFDAAHELGHLVLHRDVDHSKMDSKPIEDEANDFASAFLLPAEQFRQECPRSHNLEAFLRIKPRWGVSVQAMVRRGRDLGLLTQWHYESMFRLMAARGWRSGAESGQLPREDSAIHFQALNQLFDAGLGVDDICRLVGISKAHIQELMPVTSQLEFAQRRGFLRVVTSGD
jgi:Zn-dependent peptidase ImmA (M78 family)/DNA-binding XRE family transcriptional regulator